MHAFSRAYRDPKSPLTPLTPLATNTSFTFNISGDNTLKPFMQALESQRAKESSMLTPTGMISSVKYVNPSKYMNTQVPHAKNTMSESTVNTKKLSPRFVSTQKPKSEDRHFVNSPGKDSGSHKSKGFVKSKKLSPKYASNSSSSKKNTCSTSCDSNSSGWTSCSSKNDTSRQRSSFGSHGSSSAYSSDSNSSSSSKFSMYGASTKRKDTSRYKPPNIVITETKEGSGATVSSVFEWVWNQLSPIHNLTIYELLTRVGMEKYWDIFKREEINDLDVFSTMTIKDLKSIGIKNSNDCQKILESVRMALDFLSGLLVLKKP